MTNKKIKIISYFVGDNPEYLQLVQEAEKLNKKYAELYGYSYVFNYFDNSVISNYYGECNSKNICSYKMKFIYDNLIKDDCDILVSLDADAVISKPQIKIEDLIDEEHDLFLSRGNDIFWQNRELKNIVSELYRLFHNNNKRSYDEFWSDIIVKENGNNLYGSLELASMGCFIHNCGLYIIKNTNLMKELFKDILAFEFIMKDNVFKSAMCLEERCMSFCLLKEKYNKSFTYMYPQVQGAYAGGYQFKYNENNTFILHEYGTATTLKQKLEEVKNVFYNKWWSSIYKRTTNIIEWTKYVDAIYCLHFIPYKNRLNKFKANLAYIDVDKSNIQKWYYTYPNIFDEMIANCIKPTYVDYHNERRTKTLNLNIAYHNMFREIQEFGYNKVLIIEDDCTFIYGKKDLFIETLEHLPLDWDYIQFDKINAGNHKQDLTTLKDGTWFYSNYTGGYFGTAFTMWSKKAIDYAVKKLEEDLTIADHIFGNREDFELNNFKRYIPKHSFIYQPDGLPLYNFS